MTRVLFADLLRSKLDIPKAEGSGTYWGQLQGLLARHAACPDDWVVRLTTKKIRWERQYDKFEPAITYYLLTALAIATDGFRKPDVLVRLFNNAFSDSTTAERVASLFSEHGWDGLRFEALINPTEKHRQVVERNVTIHPVAYVREVGQKKAGVRFESPTHLDAFVGNHSVLIDGHGDRGVGIEAKFMSDIDCQTTYSPHRNQIIRNIEVGHGRFDEFFFLLLAPRTFREQKSRFYSFKMEEYLGDDGQAALQRDALITPSSENSLQWQKRIGWLSWEDIVESVFPGGSPAFDHPDAAECAQFLRERRLLS